MEDNTESSPQERKKTFKKGKKAESEKFGGGKIRVAGLKQVTKGIINKSIRLVYIATDCDTEIHEKIVSLCAKNNIEVRKEFSQEDLGKACGIDVFASVVGISGE